MVSIHESMPAEMRNDGSRKRQLINTKKAADPCDRLLFIELTGASIDDSVNRYTATVTIIGNFFKHIASPLLANILEILLHTSVVPQPLGLFRNSPEIDRYFNFLAEQNLSQSAELSQSIFQVQRCLKDGCPPCTHLECLNPMNSWTE